MSDRDILLSALIERFGDREPRLGTPPDPIATFAAKHPEVGDARVWGTTRESNIGPIVGALARRLIADYERRPSDTPSADDERPG